MTLFKSLLAFSFILSPVLGQLIGPVGPTTALSSKTIECSILDYGAVADNATDVHDALYAAFNECVLKNPGSRLIVPEGNYLLNQTVALSDGTNWAFQLDGLITAAYGGNWNIESEDILEGVFVIPNAVDFEFYSSNGLGAIQGQGYLYRLAGNTDRPRLVRLTSPVNASVHDLILVDSPKFHFIFDDGTNIEVYHLTIRGANLGSYDGIDAVGYNYHIHDNEVTNRDECVSVKSPSHYALVENLVCNQAGSGISIGSLNVSAEVSNIHARNISIIQGNNIAYIKTYPGGSGYVTNVTFENFRSKASLYGLDINQYWQNTYTPDTGSVSLSNLVFKNFTGSVANGAKRPPLYLLGNDLTYALDVVIEEFSLWTESGTYIVNTVSNIFGTGDDVYSTNDGLKSLSAGETPSPYTSSYTLSATPTAWTEPSYPTWAVASTGYGTASPIPVYTPAALWKPTGDYDKHYWGTF